MELVHDLMIAGSVGVTLFVFAWATIIDRIGRGKV